MKANGLISGADLQWTDRLVMLTVRSGLSDMEIILPHKNRIQVV